MSALWQENVKLPQFHSLSGNKTTDVLIIGGGMAGILCAHFLGENGVDYTLVEGKRIASGITKNTTAKITAQHGLIYHKLLKSIGIENARKYLEINQLAVKKYEELCGAINCDFQKKTAYVYSHDNRKKIEKEADALYRIGYNPKFSVVSRLPFPIAASVGFEDQAQFHPLKFIAKLAQGLNIYENTFVKEFIGNKAVTNNGEIVFKKLIMATHFPINNKHGLYFLKMYQHRSYVLAIEKGENIQGMYVDEDRKGMSFRNYKDLLLIGGGSHRTGKKGGNWSELREFSQIYYPYAKEKYYWATQDCMTLDGLPYIGQYSKGLCDCYVATGFNKWGMTSAMVAGMLLSDMIIGKKNEYANIFTPQRSMLKPQLFINGLEASKNLLTITKKRCPHMGCALKWNAVEQTWDCPCHGSRFSKEGKILDNPANGDNNADNSTSVS